MGKHYEYYTDLLGKEYNSKYRPLMLKSCIPLFVSWRPMQASAIHVQIFSVHLNYQIMHSRTNTLQAICSLRGAVNFFSSRFWDFVPKWGRGGLTQSQIFQTVKLGLKIWDNIQNKRGIHLSQPFFTIKCLE